MAKHFASALAKDNPFFDAAKFTEACQFPSESGFPRFEVVQYEGGWRVRDDETGLVSPVPFSEKVARRKAEEENRGYI